jgi:hypothetical protein
MYTHYYTYTWRIPLKFFFSPLCWLPFVPALFPFPLTWHPPAVTGIVHLSLRLLGKLTPFAPPITQLPPPLQIPTPTAQRLTKTTSGIFRLLLSGTLILHLFRLRGNNLFVKLEQYKNLVLVIFRSSRLPAHYFLSSVFLKTTPSC